MTPEEHRIRDRVIDRSRRRDLFIAAWLQNPENGKGDLWRIARDAVRMADAVMAVDAFQSEHDGKLPKLHSMHGYPGTKCYDCSHPEDEWCSDVIDPEPEMEPEKPISFSNSQPLNEGG